MYHASNNKNTKIDMYAGYKGENGVLGTTVSYINQTAMPAKDKDKKNWHWGKITLNRTYLESNSNANKQRVIIHKMGHVMGLKDINKTSSIMHYDSRGGMKVTKDAHNAINQKY
ncbi:matrixin family metalloprotease [Mycoplasma sp. P36-A1]|uniref:matrixin family metalloprotease n=1 Tax=Mycoplasma sp. P36-A1 TaxID=3252900 RepID=UPI003C2C3CA2